MQVYDIIGHFHEYDLISHCEHYGTTSHHGSIDELPMSNAG